MKALIPIIIYSIILIGCKPIQEKILGTYDIDPERGCSNCEESGPELMVFEDWNLDDGNPGYYSFNYQNGENHSGTYDILQIDTVSKIMLYPDSATVEFYGLLGTVQETEYKVVGNKIKENCDGIFRNCIWIRRD
jgi:hypothetical protein